MREQENHHVLRLALKKCSSRNTGEARGHKDEDGIGGGREGN